MKVELVMDNDSAKLRLIPETVFERHLSLAIESLNYTTVGTAKVYDGEGDARGMEIVFMPTKKEKA